jgi:uncharacterized tellurite resistance protein B-like protein
MTMGRPSNSVALLRVLIAAAWSDSTLSRSELNSIKQLARRFRLDDDEWFGLQPYLEDPPTEEETRIILEDLLSRVGSARERDEISRHIRAVIEADERISEEEKAFLEEYERLFETPTSLDLFFGRLKGLFGRTPAQSSLLDVDEFLRNKILFRLKRRLGDGEIPPDTHRLALLGGLMGIVAQADGEIHPRELDAIRSELARRGRFEDETLDLLLAIIEEESVRGLDRYRIITEYAQDISTDERRELLDLLFGVAASDGGLTHAELEELRSISSALHLSHKQYINAKVRVLED